MKRFSFFLLFALGFLPAVEAPAQAIAAGSTPGSFRVTESGAAEYRIPIQVPPGIAGMEPKLALVYNSQAGNGLLGVGWTLEGLSSITRCPRTVAQDGVRGAVSYDSNDRFCLDGQRLMAIDGSYGADGTEYRTERESFSKVMSYGTAGTGPAWFKVWTKGGQILEYGNTADSRIEAQGNTTARVWTVNKISDTKGNHLTLSYAEENGDGRLHRIDYAGPSAAGGGASVRFLYETRPDKPLAYLSGAAVRIESRLLEVQAHAGEILARKYTLAYDVGASTARSRPVGIAECNASGGCLPAFSFAWQEGSDAFSYSGGRIDATDWGSDATYTKLAGDVNGDGRTDVIAVRADSGGLYVYTALGQSNKQHLYRGGGRLEASDWGWSWTFLAADVNGDGRTDLLAVHTDPAGLWVFRVLGQEDGSMTYAGGGRIESSDWNWSWRIFAADVNGDGRTDLVFAHTEAAGLWVYTALAQGDGSITYRGGGRLDSTDWNWTWTVMSGDVNGDGMADLVFAHTDAAGLATYSVLGQSDGSMTYRGGGRIDQTDWNWSWFIQAADVNGDGNTDIVFVHTDPAGLWVFAALAKGDGLFAYNGGGRVDSTDWSWPVAVQALDVNADGRADVVLSYTSDGGLWVYKVLAREGGIFVYAGGGRIDSTDWSAPWVRLAGDTDGDGRPELIFTRSYSQGLWVYSAGPPAIISDLQSTMTNGSGAAVSVVYKPIADASVHTKEAAPGYPEAAFQGPLQVVASHSQTSGIGGSVQSSVAYGGARTHLQGRGFLGFRWKEESEERDGQTKISLRSEWSQDWPYLGMASLRSLVKITPSSSMLLGQAVRTFGCADPASGAACAIAAGHRYFPYVSQSVQSGNDLGGAALPTITTKSEYDAYGNATSVEVGTRAPGASEDVRRVTKSEYENAAPSWSLGRLKKSTVGHPP